MLLVAFAPWAILYILGMAAFAEWDEEKTIGLRIFVIVIYMAFNIVWVLCLKGMGLTCLTCNP